MKCWTYVSVTAFMENKVIANVAGKGKYVTLLVRLFGMFL